MLRTLDKCDKLGVDGVVELLQKPPHEFGADLDPVTAGLLGQFVGCVGRNNDETLGSIKQWFTHARRVRSRMEMMMLLEAQVGENGCTKWDTLINMPINEDNTWSDRRPHNIGWALDDIILAIKSAKE